MTTAPSGRGTMTKHTPGPWRVSYGVARRPGIDNFPLAIRSEAGEHIIETASPDAPTFGCSPSEARANARLIAAAPELLAICQEMEAHMRVQTGKTGEAHAAEGHDIRRRMNEIIAKAEG